MTEEADRYEHFRSMKSGSERIAEAEAASDPTPPTDPATLNWDPVPIGSDRWKIHNDSRVFRSADEARRAGQTARGRAERNYANYVNALITPDKTPGQAEAEEYEVAKARALADGVTPDAWNNSPQVRAAYLPDSRHGAELWEEYKRSRKR